MKTVYLLSSALFGCFVHSTMDLCGCIMDFEDGRKASSQGLHPEPWCNDPCAYDPCYHCGVCFDKKAPGCSQGCNDAESGNTEPNGDRWHDCVVCCAGWCPNADSEPLCNKCCPCCCPEDEAVQPSSPEDQPAQLSLSRSIGSNGDYGTDNQPAAQVMPH